MAHYNQDWDDLGRSIQDIVDRAVNSKDFQKLNQTIRQTVGRAVDVGGQVVRKVVDGSSRPPVAGKQNLSALYGSTGSKTAKGILKTCGGALICCLTVPLALLFLIALPITASYDMIMPAVLSMLGSAYGIWLTYNGINTLAMVKRFKTYRRTLGKNTYCTLEKLARSVGKNVEYVRKELRRMIDQGLFLEGHLDKDETSLITSDETYRYYEQSWHQLEECRQQERQQQEAAARIQAEAAARDPQVQSVLDRGNAFIAQIRKCNDDIPGEEISAKIDRMETIVRRIFQRAQEHPEIVPDLQKMMDYYLPMTVKLLNAYADMDAQPVQGENIQSSKREIEASLDTLNLAFEKLLDSVFKDTAMDVSSDISVLNTLLAQDGLTEDDLSKLKKEHNPQ